MSTNLKVNRSVLLLLFVVFILLVGCADSEPSESQANNNDNKNTENENDSSEEVTEDSGDTESEEEITLRFWYPGDPEEINERLGEIFPHITFEWHEIQVVNAYKETIEEEFAKEQIPDIMVLQDYSLSILKGYEMLYDLSPLIEKHNLDMGHWPEHRVKAMRAHQPDDEGIYSLPADLTTHALAYNKEVFDLFGAPYPTDDMTWDEVIELARLVTGERDGVQYRGLDIAADAQMVGMLDDWLVTADNEVHFEGRDDVRELFGLMETIANIPGNIPDNDKTDFFDPWSYGIYNEGNVAMTVHARYIARGLEEAALEGKIDEYDFVSWPIWDIDNPTQPYTGGNFYSISPYTEHPDEAFKVIEYLISDEWLDYIDPLDYNMEGLKSKNMEAFNRHPLNVPESRSSEHQVTGRWLFGVNSNKIIYEGIDVNTAIRQAQEEAEAMIKDAEGSE